MCSNISETLQYQRPNVTLSTNLCLDVSDLSNGCCLRLPWCAANNLAPRLARAPSMTAALRFATSTPSKSPHRTHTIPPSALTHRHGRPPELDIPLGCPRRHRLLCRAVVDIRRQGWHTRRHLRSSFGSEGAGRERGHTLPGALAAARHRLRRPHTAEEHQHHHRLQGLADGYPDAEGAAPPGSQAAAQDLPGASCSVACAQS